jgi:hypothetical protein
VVLGPTGGFFFFCRTPDYIVPTVHSRPIHGCDSTHVHALVYVSKYRLPQDCMHGIKSVPPARVSPAQPSVCLSHQGSLLVILPSALAFFFFFFFFSSLPSHADEYERGASWGPFLARSGSPATKTATEALGEASAKQVKRQKSATDESNQVREVRRQPAG